MGKIKVFLKNVRSFHHRVMARFLRKRGWIVFYLEEPSRICSDGACWMKLYLEEEAKFK